MSNYASWDLYSLGKRYVEWKRRAKESPLLQQRLSYEGELRVIGDEFNRKAFTGPFWPTGTKGER